MRGALALMFLAAPMLLGVLSCENEAVRQRAARVQTSPQGDTTSTTSSPTPQAPRTPNDAERRHSRCVRRTSEALKARPLPGAPRFDEQRALVLARAKAHPSLFVREPEAQNLSGPAKVFRQRIETSSHPSSELYELYPTLRGNAAWARDVLLSEGYLYSPVPSLAHALTTVVQLPDLFTESELFVQRGHEVLRLARRKSQGAYHYVLAEGPDAGQVARILLLDRVATSRQHLAAPLHRTLDDVRETLGFERVTVRTITAEHLYVDAHYGELSVPTLLRTDGVRTSLDCEQVPPGRERELEAARQARRERRRYVQALREVIDQMIDEQLPFDEPKTEVGQQDGKLRQEWKWAYRFGHSRFDFNDDTYSVFDFRGRPRVPQVCIDFITDAFERASGSWYLPRGEGRDRSPGRFSFDAYDMDNRRSVESFVSLAASLPAAFDVLQLEAADQIPLRRRKRFYSYLSEHRAEFIPGDVVVILGLRDDEKEHYHSFFVIDSDPVTAMPTLLASNAGRPRVRTWEDEMSNAPRRSIRTRVRPRIEWLRTVVSVADDVALVPQRDAVPPI